MTYRFKTNVHCYVTGAEMNRLLDAIEAEAATVLTEALTPAADRLAALEAEIKRLRAELDAERRYRMSPMMRGRQMTPARPSPQAPAVLKHTDHRRLWRAVEGSVADALQSHPEYLTDAGRKSAVLSITKRVVGAVVALGSQTRKGGRLGGCKAEGAPDAPASGGDATAVVGEPCNGLPRTEREG